MTWGKVDDKLHSHPKTDVAGLEAMGLWVMAMSYCVDQLTDGFISEERCARLVGEQAKASQLASRLVASGLWLKAQGGYHFHDWHAYQPTAESVRSERDRKAKNVSAHRSRRAQPAPSVPPIPSRSLPVSRPVTAPVTGYTTGNATGYGDGYKPVVYPAMLPVRNHGPDPDPDLTKEAAASSQFQPEARATQSGGGESEIDSRQPTFLDAISSAAEDLTGRPDASPIGAATEPAQGEALPPSDGQGPIPEEIPPVKAKPEPKPPAASGGLADVWATELAKYEIVAHLANDQPSVQLLASRSFDHKLRKDRVGEALKWAVDQLEVKSVSAAGGCPLSHEATMKILVAGIRGEVTKRHKAQARGEPEPREPGTDRLDCFTLERRKEAFREQDGVTARIMADIKAGRGIRWG